MRAYSAVLALLLSPCLAKLSFKSGKATVAGPGTQTFEVHASKPNKPITLASDENLSLAFTIFDDASSKDVQPHQTFLRFWDPETEEEGIVPVKVSKDGKAKFTMNLRRPPSGLPPTSKNPLKVSLILGSFTYDSATYPLFDLTLPPSGTVPPHPEESTFHVQPELFHTFQPEQKVPNKFISLVFAGLVASPWLLLLSLLTYLPISVAPSSRTLPFIGLLAAFEGVLLWYWVDLYLGQVLTYGAALGLVTAIAGKRALSSS